MPRSSVPSVNRRVDKIVRPNTSAALAALKIAEKVVLACHIKPDGDALGSMLALALGLKSLGKTVVPLSADGVPRIYQFLPDSETVLTHTDRRDFDLGIVLDAGDIERIGQARPAITSALRLMNIDHHITTQTFGHIRLLDSTASATAEIVYDILVGLGVEITAPIAENLLCGLITDTGQFRFPSVTPRTMQIGAEMIRAGASPNRIVEETYENRTLSAQRLMGRALAALQTADDGRIVWTTITRDDLKATGASDEATEGVMNGIRVVRGSIIAFLLHELESGEIRVSLRARPGHDVAKIAAVFGGGGHRLAAGCTLPAPMDEAQQRVLRECLRDLA